jgi:hypothetical protein
LVLPVLLALPDLREKTAGQAQQAPKATRETEDQQAQWVLPAQKVHKDLLAVTDGPETRENPVYKALRENRDHPAQWDLLGQKVLLDL